MKHRLLALGLALAASTASAQLSATGPEIDFSGYNGAPVARTGLLAKGLLNGLLDAGRLGGTVIITFLGKDDAWHTDVLSIGGVDINNQTTPVGQSYSFDVGAGPLNFGFKDTTDGDTVGNGIPGSRFASFVAISNRSLPSSVPFDFILGFNDGQRTDADYDDLVVGMNFAPVPEPETYAMTLIGLGALGFIARRRLHKGP